MIAPLRAWPASTARISARPGKPQLAVGDHGFAGLEPFSMTVFLPNARPMRDDAGSTVLSAFTT